MPKIITAKNNANTDDIIYHLAMAAPAAIAQIKKANLHEIIGLTGANLQKDAEITGKWIRSNIQYVQDSFENQNIQFPSAILKTKKADCKSLSLLYLAIMQNAGYNGGFRFASYRPNKRFTHVYNYFVDNKGNKLTFDACIPNLKESTRYTNIKDMKVNYLAGAPIMVDDSNTTITRPVKRKILDGVLGYQYQDTGEFISEPEFIGRKKLRDRINNAWKNIKKKAGNVGKKAWQGFKKVNLAAPRIAFLGIVKVNARGFASKLKRLLDKSPDKVKELWERFGGDYTKLFDAIKAGANKKPLFGTKGGKKRGKRGINGIEYIEEPNYVGLDPATLTAAIASATPIIVALVKVLKKEGIQDAPEETPPPDDEGIPEPTGEDKEAFEATKSGKFVPGDPDGEEATAYVKSSGQVFVNTKGEIIEQPKGTAGGSDLLNPKNLLILGGIAIGAIVLLKRKK